VNGVHFAAYDGNGNVSELTKATDGTVSARYEYGPFGEVLRATGPVARVNPLRFSTKYQDDETDFLYYGYRCYNQSTGRWFSRDPIGELGGRNMYEALRDDPVNTFDPFGQCCTCVTSLTLTDVSKININDPSGLVIYGHSFKVIFRALASSVAIFMLCGCLSCHPKTMVRTDMDGHKWAVIALVGGMDEDTQGHVRDALARKNITCIMEGSIGYEVRVPLARCAEAKMLLRTDPNLKDRAAIATASFDRGTNRHWEYSDGARTRILLF